jgi:hypothetical protein
MSVESIDLFPIQIFKKRCSNHDTIKKYMIDMVYQDFINKGPNDKRQNAYTDYVEGATFIHWPYLYSLYESDIKSMLAAVGFSIPNIKISLKGWYMFTEHSESMLVHDHTGGPSTIQFAVVHYINLEKDSKGTVFHNPWARSMKATTPTKDIKLIPNYYLNFNNCPDVVEGDIVMFPAWLDHNVPMHDNNTLRVTNALNVTVRLDNSDGM